MNRRRFAAVALAFAGAPRSHAAWFGPDVREIELGSSSSGVIDPKVSRSVTARSRWVYVNTCSQEDMRLRPEKRTCIDKQYLENDYQWNRSVQLSTEIWQITAEDQKLPLPVALRVRNNGTPMLVRLFVGVDSASDLDAEKGYGIAPSAETPAEWLAIFDFNPKLKHFVLVQTQSDERVPYRLAVVAASRFRP